LCTTEWKLALKKIHLKKNEEELQSSLPMDGPGRAKQPPSLPPASLHLGKWSLQSHYPASTGRDLSLEHFNLSARPLLPSLKNRPALIVGDCVSLLSPQAEDKGCCLHFTATVVKKKDSSSLEHQLGGCGPVSFPFLRTA
jgi:hypothetical protein